MSEPILAGHRGFKAKCPENTILSYDAAADSGCDVVETDLHISTDNIIVISHDSETERVFGKSYNVTQESYKDTLSKLRTLREPHLPMPTLNELLKWCREKSEKTGRNIQLMLDIKKDCDPKLLLKLLLQDLEEAGPNIEYWHNKLIFGMWDSRYYCKEMDPFRIINITFDIDVAEKVVAEIKERAGEFRLFQFFTSYYTILHYPGNCSNFCVKNDIKIWFWTINLKKEAIDAVNFCALPSGESILAGLITDDPIEASAKRPENLGIMYNANLFVKRHLYVGFLYLLHNNYNVVPIFTLLKTLGLL
ncbi:PGC1 [Brettanomyces bruxellensis]|uniref:DEBR0S1_05952g1_1 n=1 Tax=Dekkera bruxellensis TaxID=5007 RepID=A0A7D9GWW8_DEKBR|nr:PGC1 [Brettanomyces bruxellensis]